MDPITLVGNILGVAKSLLGITDKLQSAEQARKEKIGSLFENISNCLIGDARAERALLFTFTVTR